MSASKQGLVYKLAMKYKRSITSCCFLSILPKIFSKFTIIFQQQYKICIELDVKPLKTYNYLMPKLTKYGYVKDFLTLEEFSYFANLQMLSRLTLKGGGAGENARHIVRFQQ